MEMFVKLTLSCEMFDGDDAFRTVGEELHVITRIIPSSDPDAVESNFLAAVGSACEGAIARLLQEPDRLTGTVER